MSLTRTPLLIVAFAILCCLVTSVTNLRMCIDSGTDENDFMKFALKAADFEAVTMTECNRTEKCFECVTQKGGIMYYGATCAVSMTDLSEISCSDPGLEPCSSSEDTKCYPKFRQIRNLPTCRRSFTTDKAILEGGFDVHCNGTCSSAVMIENEQMHECKSCTADCRRWHESMKKHFPNALTKFCEGAQSCSIEGWPKVEAASDDFSDDDSGSCSVAANRAAVLAFVATFCLALAI